MLECFSSEWLGAEGYTSRCGCKRCSLLLVPLGESCVSKVLRYKFVRYGGSIQKSLELVFEIIGSSQENQNRPK